GGIRIRAVEPAPPYALFGIYVIVVLHDGTLSARDARDSALACGVGGVGTGGPLPFAFLTRANTSSLGPNAIALPSYSTIVMSSAESALGRCEITTTIEPLCRMVEMARVSAFSPSASRLALGSSSTSRNGSP